MTYWPTLTQYEALSESSASHRAGSPAATAADDSRPSGIDVRTLEWIRPLVGEYAFNFRNLSQLYAGDPARPDAWRDHHQGGPTGYLARERVATPGDDALLPAGAAVAWNPSLPGSKSEDTVLVRPDGRLEVVTFDPRWPTTEVAGRDRPAVFVR